MQNSTFPYKTVLSKAKLKTNKTVSTKWTYHKKRSFATLFFRKVFSVTNHPNVHTYTFRKRWSFIFPVSILQKICFVILFEGISSFSAKQFFEFKENALHFISFFAVQGGIFQNIKGRFNF